MMMKATLKGNYETDKNHSEAGTTLSLNAPVGDSFLRASITKTLALDSSPDTPPSFALSLEKPDSFVVDYKSKKGSNLEEKKLPNLKFKFMNSLKLMKKAVNLTYSHEVVENKTTVDGSVEFNEENKMSVSHVLGTKDCTLKYTYAIGQRRRITVEPTYDVATNAWTLAVLRKFEGSDALRATYKRAEKTMELEWSRDSKDRGAFKISASLGTEDKPIYPKFKAESSWTYEL